MLDLRAIRDDPGTFRAGLDRRGAGADLDRLLELDARWRDLTVRVEHLRAEQNRSSKDIGRAEGEERDRLIAAVKAVSGELKELEPDLADATEERDVLLSRLPNPPHPSVPQGETDEDNELVRDTGPPPDLGFEPKDHVDLGTAIGLLDLERGARTSGSRFVYLTGPGAWLQFGLVRYTLDVVTPHGFVPVIPPVLVREEAMFGTGFFPTDEAQIYATRDDDLYLVGTSEVPLAALHQDEILDAAVLPIRYCGYSTCFRREAGAHGKDTRGMFRFSRPEDSWEEHEFLLSLEERIVGGLGIPYRVMNVYTGELGPAAAKK